MVTHTYANVQSVLDFGPIVKPLGITVKKEAGKVVETSGEIDIVKPQATREFQKRGNNPGAPKKGAEKIFEFSKMLRLQNFMAWCLRRCW